MVIHVFPELMSPRDDDGDDAQTATEHDASGSRVAHDDICRLELGEETIVREIRLELSETGGARRTALDEAANISPSPGEPIVDPSDQPG